jgi:hypothetical protein
MLRCAASFVTAAYVRVRLAPHDLHTLPAELFTQPSNPNSFRTSYESIIFKKYFSGIFATISGNLKRIYQQDSSIGINTHLFLIFRPVFRRQRKEVVD